MDPKNSKDHKQLWTKDGYHKVPDKDEYKNRLVAATVINTQDEAQKWARLVNLLRIRRKLTPEEVINQLDDAHIHRTHCKKKSQGEEK